MASLVYNSFLEDLAKAVFDLDTATVKGMLVTSTYSPNKDTHTKRSDVTNEVSGAGYTAGGATITATITKDTANDRLDISFANPSWSTATITARALVLYISRGGAASADELIAYADFGSDVTSTGATFSVTFTSPIRFQN